MFCLCMKAQPPFMGNVGPMVGSSLIHFAYIGVAPPGLVEGEQL